MASPRGQMGVSKSAAILTGGGMLEFLLQFLVPVILVRHLDTDQFGQYRLLILMLGTVLGLAPAFMPQSLYYFLPSASEERKRTIIGNVIAYLSLVGLVAAIAASPLSTIGGPMLDSLFHASHGLSSVFLGLSVLLSITTTIAIAEGRILWHFYTDLVIALVRAALVCLAAVLSHSIEWVVAALVVDTVIRVCILMAYLATRPDGGRLGVQPRLLVTQLWYALPLALGASLFVMRVQADQWIAATMFSSAAFAAFTIGVVVLPIAALIRQPINSAMLPRLSADFASGKHASVHRLLVQGCGATMLILVPVAGLLFVLAPDIVALVYTERYLAAVPVMRAYLVVVALQSLAFGYAMPILNMGKTALVVNGAGLLISLCASLLGAWRFGLVGAALGSVIAFAVCEAWNMVVIAKLLGISSARMLPLRLLVIIASAVTTGLLVALSYGAGPGVGTWQALVAKAGLYGATIIAVFATAGGVNEIRRARGMRTA